MVGGRTIRFILKGILAVISVSFLSAQEGGHHIIDFAELPVALTGVSDSPCFTEFREHWVIRPENTSISKDVLEFDTLCISNIRDLQATQRIIRIRDLSHEFIFLDPHLVESYNKAIPDPDSMDNATRKLQAEIIELIKRSPVSHARFNLEDQLLSILFHEDWSIDPVSMVITKKIRGLTPVIWQQRQTTSGEPVNDAETGLPVYYKNQLERIHLRNP